ncbi:MAG: nucleoside-diphosphate kinase, partial [Burkholderiales bacterium]|nr:nucleoside-diphosphate kinase [Burkholderiales bacterium]
IAKYREVMGATDPTKAKKGTLRERFALSTQQNSVHGSDSSASAEREIAFSFSPEEIV